MSQPSLVIIIVNWNTADFLTQCLTSIAQVSTLSAEVIVVDNASADDSCRVVREQFPWVTLIESGRNLGFAAANNLGIDASQSQYVLLLNSDTQLLPDAIEQMISFLENHPQAAAVGPRLLNEDGSLQPSCHPMLTPGREFWRLSFLDRLLPRARYDIAGWNSTTPRRVDVIKGACLLLRRQALEQVGLLDTGYFMYTEEVDLCYRLDQRGWEVWWLPGAQVIHYGEASSRQVADEMYVELYRSKVRFYRKFGGDEWAQQFIRLTKLAYWPRMAITTIVAFFSPALRGRAKTYRRLMAELDSM